MRRSRPDTKATRLRHLAVFADCPDTDVTFASRLGDLATVPAGSVLVREGCAGSQFLIVVDGEAAVTRAGEHVATLRPGNFFGEVSLLTQRPRNATVTAATDLTVLAFDPRSFAELLRAVPAVHQRVAAAVASRLTPPAAGVGAAPVLALR